MHGPKPEERPTVQIAIGTVLRKRREELGWDEQNIADHLRIRLSLLQALEQSDYKALPGHVYAIGFLRNYAVLMGLDADKVIAAFKRELAAAGAKQSEEAPQLDFPQAAAAERSLPKWVLITSGLIVVLAAYIGWYHFSSHDEDGAQKADTALLVDNTSNDGPQSPGSSEGDSEGEGDDNAASSSDSDSGPANVVNEDSADNSATQLVEEPSTGQETNQETPEAPSSQASTPQAPSPQASTSPSVAAPADPEVQQQKSPFEESAPAQTTESQFPKPSEPVVNSGEVPAHAVQLHFTQDSWVKIADHSGKVIEERVFKAGENWNGDGGAAPYIITAGNASGVVMKAGNVTSAPLGKPGQVRRNISVTAEGIIGGTFGHTDSPPDRSVQSVGPNNVLQTGPKNLEQTGQKH